MADFEYYDTIEKLWQWVDVETCMCGDSVCSSNSGDTSNTGNGLSTGTDGNELDTDEVENEGEV
eukprot:Awhi_evm1s9404